MVRAYFDEARKANARSVAEDWFLRMLRRPASRSSPSRSVPLASSGEEAEAILRLLVLRGHGAKVRAAAKKYGKDASAAVEELLSARAPKKMKPPKLPAYLDVEKLPSLGGLDREETANLLRYAMAWPPKLVEEDESATEQNPFGPEAPVAGEEVMEEPLEIEQVFKVHIPDWHPCVLETKRRLAIR